MPGKVEAVKDPGHLDVGEHRPDVRVRGRESTAHRATLAARKRLEAVPFENVDHVLADEDLVLDHEDDGVFMGIIGAHGAETTGVRARFPPCAEP